MYQRNYSIAVQLLIVMCVITSASFSPVMAAPVETASEIRAEVYGGRTIAGEPDVVFDRHGSISDPDYNFRPQFPDFRTSRADLTTATPLGQTLLNQGIQATASGAVRADINGLGMSLSASVIDPTFYDPAGLCIRNIICSTAPAFDTGGVNASAYGSVDVHYADFTIRGDVALPPTSAFNLELHIPELSVATSSLSSAAGLASVDLAMTIALRNAVTGDPILGTAGVLHLDTNDAFVTSAGLLSGVTGPGLYSLKIPFTLPFYYQVLPGPGVIRPPLELALGLEAGVGAGSFYGPSTNLAVLNMMST